MAWTSPPTLSPGNVLPAADWNILCNDLIFLENHVGLYGASAAYSGSFPGNPGLLLQAGTVIVTTGGAGQFSISFPATFPAGVLTILLTPGDQNLIGQMSLSVQGSVVATTGFSAQAFQGTGGIASSNLRINYLALGF